MKTKKAFDETKQAFEEFLFSEEEESSKAKDTEVVDILEEYDERLQSPLSRVARWVDELAWYYHLMLLTVIVAGAVTLGFFLNAIAICAVAAGLIYVVAVGLLKLHHYYEKKRSNAMTEMTAYAEERLHQGIEEVEDMGADLENLAEGLVDACKTMDECREDFAKQAEKQQEQTEETMALNQKLQQLHATVDKTNEHIDKTVEQIQQDWGSLHSNLVENVTHLNETEASLAKSALAIKQSATASVSVHEAFSRNVDALGLIIDDVKENVSLENSLLKQVYQSTIVLAESIKETSQNCQRLKLTLEVSEQLIQSSEQLIDGFAEDRKLAEEDRRHDEETIRILERNEREFQAALARLMINTPTYTPDQPRSNAAMF